jgi:quinol-cytochrome oxidoreductase complex cytochrome b subunit
VVFTGAYAAPRRFNFLLGVSLLALVMLMNFTGYILRWDEGIRWALVVGSNLLKTIPIFGEALYQFVMGGSGPNPATLTRFYAWHIFGLTLFFAPLVIWHLFRVRRDGGISAPPPELRPETERIPRQELFRREIQAALLAMAALLAISLLVPAPIGTPIQGTAAALDDSYAPWFFLWIQQLLRYGDAFWMGVGLPLGLLTLYLVLPYLLPGVPDAQKGRWFPRAGRLAQALTLVAILGWALLTILELMKR